MSELRNVRELLERTHAVLGNSLLEVDRRFDSELASSNPYIADILEHTRRFRGKRLRPMLCLLVAKALGGIQEEHLILATVVEMIHTATLVHDDVLDEADVRRHVATVNVRWNNQTSVLYGDFLFTHAFHLAASTNSAHACRLIGRATNRVCEGELLQTRNRGNLVLSEEEYYSIINGKTAELCAVSCELGAIYAGADETTIKAMESYGRSLGMAFQIADDVLDLVGMEDTIGKTLGTDLAQQKLTLPVIRLIQGTSGADRDRLTHTLETLTPEGQRTVLQQLRDQGFLEESLATARRFAEEARSQLAKLPESGAKDLLMQLPDLSIERSC